MRPLRAEVSSSIIYDNSFVVNILKTRSILPRVGQLGQINTKPAQQASTTLPAESEMKGTQGKNPGHPAWLRSAAPLAIAFASGSSAGTAVGARSSLMAPPNFKSQVR